ncbi:MAG: MlaE family lipid ABC transporter permease subunit [Parvibaculum sp.]|uniref:ABC transporter permease n=1 Tax=Parvibaculum sp. TaxID=2024848 RepID=UPI00349FF986
MAGARESARSEPGAGAPASCETGIDGETLHIALSGDWSIVHLDPVDRQLRALTAAPPAARKAEIDFAGIDRFDTAGACVLARTARLLEARGLSVALTNMSEAQRLLSDKIGAGGVPEPIAHPAQPFHIEVTGRIGAAMRAIGDEALGMLAFVGAVVSTLGRTIVHPSRLRVVPFVHHMEKAGFDALPLVCLLTFLIGAVVAQQGAVQLRQFGAEVFTVNLIAIIFLREVGLLLTAIIVAGRSGSAFTAEIGSMKMREEIDAMRTLGLDPMDMLVVPRVLALIVALPMLTFVANIMGLFGGGVVAQFMLGMSPGVYIQRVHEAIGFWTFGVGIVKAPFMAATIALVGCRAGMAVTGSAESVGAQTTRSVVYSIFLVIVLDALFAMFFTAVDI